MERSEAIKVVAISQLQSLTNDERSEQLEVMLLEDWTEMEAWNNLPSDIQFEFKNGELLSNFKDSKYDCVLILWLKDDLKAVTNDFLLKSIKDTSNSASEIEGKPVQLISCPCCGYRTLDEPASYDICNVCWWEDDGQDNENADIGMGGPNYGISLTKARYNFISFGIYDPKRKDLMKLRKPKEMFVKGREFVLMKNNTITESGINESWVLTKNA